MWSKLNSKRQIYPLSFWQTFPVYISNGDITKRVKNSGVAQKKPKQTNKKKEEITNIRVYNEST